MVGEQHRNAALGLEACDLHGARFGEKFDRGSPLRRFGKAIDGEERFHLALDIGFAVVRSVGGFDKLQQFVADQPGEAFFAAILEFILQCLEIAIPQLAGKAADSDFTDPDLFGQRHRGFKGERGVMRQHIGGNRAVGRGIALQIILQPLQQRDIGDRGAVGEWG